MNKRIKIVLLCCLLLMICSFVFTACGIDGQPPIQSTDNTGPNDTQSNTLFVPTTQVQLNKSNGFATVVNVTSTYSLNVWYSIEDTGIVGCEWGSWTDSTVPLILTGKKDGSTKVYVYVEKDGSLSNALDSVTLTVTVSGMNSDMNTGSQGLRYSVYGDGYEVSMGSCADANVVIPATYNGRPVVAIDDYGFSMQSGLESVTLPDSITKLGYGAFFKSSNLISINIPDGVKSIGESAFKGCTSLSSITIRDSVTSIEDEAFSDCTSLTEVHLSEGLKSIGNYAFSGCSSLTGINFPNSLQSIGEHAFYECTGITVLKTGDRLRSIGGSAFGGCRNLSTVILSDSVETIGDMAFYECVRLTNLYLGSGLSDIYYAAFSSCNSLTHAFYNGTSSQWKKVINEGLRCDVYQGEQPKGDIVNIEDRMTKILVISGLYNKTMYLAPQFRDIVNHETIIEYRFTVDVYDTKGNIAYTYIYQIAADGTDSLSKLFALPQCSNAKGYEAIISQIGIVYKDGSDELAFTDYATTLSLGTALTNVDEGKIANPDDYTAYN